MVGMCSQALQPLFQADEEPGTRDNAAGAVSRMILALGSHLPLEQVSPQATPCALGFPVATQLPDTSQLEGQFNEEISRLRLDGIFMLSARVFDQCDNALQLRLGSTSWVLCQSEVISTVVMP